MSIKEHDGFNRYVIGLSPIEVGRYTYGYESMSVLEWGEGASLKIGSFCSIAEGLVVMLGGNHRVDWATTYPFGHIFKNELGGEGIVGHPKTNGDVIIGSDVWIERNSTIMSGVQVGNGAIIAANSTVTKNISAYEIWGGNPANKIKSRFDEDIVSYLLRLCWWDWDVRKIEKVAPLLSKPPSLDILAQIASIAEN